MILNKSHNILSSCYHKKIKILKPMKIRLSSVGCILGDSTLSNRNYLYYK